MLNEEAERQRKQEEEKRKQDEADRRAKEELELAAILAAMAGTM